MNEGTYILNSSSGPISETCDWLKGLIRDSRKSYRDSVGPEVILVIFEKELRLEDVSRRSEVSGSLN